MLYQHPNDSWTGECKRTELSNIVFCFWCIVLVQLDDCFSTRGFMCDKESALFITTVLCIFKSPFCRLSTRVGARWVRGTFSWNLSTSDCLCFCSFTTLHHDWLWSLSGNGWTLGWTIVIWQNEQGDNTSMVLPLCWGLLECSFVVKTFYLLTGMAGRYQWKSWRCGGTPNKDMTKTWWSMDSSTAYLGDEKYIWTIVQIELLANVYGQVIVCEVLV